MKPTRLLDQATTPDGTPLTLREHDVALSIRVGGVELMSTQENAVESRALGELSPGFSIASVMNEAFCLLVARSR